MKQLERLRKTVAGGVLKLRLGDSEFNLILRGRGKKASLGGNWTKILEK